MYMCVYVCIHIYIYIYNDIGRGHRADRRWTRRRPTPRACSSLRCSSSTRQISVVCVYIYIYICTHVHVYIYIYIYIYTHVHIYIYIYIYIYVYQGQGRSRTETRYGAVLATEKRSVGTAATLLYNTTGVHAVPTFLSLLSTVLKQAASGAGSSITVTNHPMPRSLTETLDVVVSAVVNLLSTFVIIQAFSWIPAAIVAYVVREREAHHNSKHQQLISGVGLVAYWTANMAWDCCIYTVPLCLSMLCMKVFSIDVFIQGGAFWASFVVFAGYGLAIAPFSYLMSFLFSRHSTAQVLCLVINFISGLITQYNP